MGNLGYHQSPLGSSGLRVLVASLVAALNLMIWPENGLACECAPLPPPCVEYSETPIIFIGTVTEAIQTENGWVRLVRMRIDKAYKGISEETVILHDDGMCDGPTLQVGEQYLMYTHDDGTAYLPSRGCTRSRNVKYADEDLAFLNSLAGAARTGTISGEVTMSTGNLARTGDPLAGATIEILNEQEKPTTTTTDSNGRYSFFGLEPGAYAVRGTKPGFSRTESDEKDTAKVEARGCAVVDLVLNKNWPGTIRGRVIRSDGSPAQPGLSLDLIRVEGTGRDQKSELLIGSTVRTDQNGDYSFNGVAPGAYKIVLNIYKAPTAENPYPEQYWPHADKEAGASTIEINETVDSQHRDFRLPAALQSERVQFIVLLPDGTPAKDVNVNIGTEMNGMFTWVDGQTNTDESGRFSFRAIEGFDYTVVDIRTDEAVMASEVHFSGSDRGRPITIKLVPKDR